MGSRAPRVALYSHDAMGIGHLRRNLLIAGSLASSGASVLLVAGVTEATAFRIPPRVDVLTLPALRKGAGGVYESRRLDISSDEMVVLRASTLRAALDSFAPDLFVVDKLPLGVAGELEPALASLKLSGRTRCVLGLRDVLDEPTRVRAEWRDRGYAPAVERYYDAVWVYGDPTVYDMVVQYGFDASMAAKVRYTGYLERVAAGSVGQRAAEDADLVRSLGLPEGGRLALCMLGGGEDGAELAQAFARAALPADMAAVVLAGPFMPREDKRRLDELAAGNPRLRVLDFVPESAALLRRADRVITMGGYNCVCEALCAGKRALVVPRVRPRVEQWIRAQRLGEMGLVDVLHPDDASPEALSRWLHGSASSRPPAPPRGIDFNGLGRLPGMMNEALRRNGDHRASVAAAAPPPGAPSASLVADAKASPNGGRAHPPTQEASAHVA